MGLPVLVIGRSGSGKTYSLKNFQPGEVGVISVEKGRLPFRSEIKTIRVPKYENSADINTYAQANLAKYSWIMGTIKKAKAKAIVIDDSQYLMVNEFFDRMQEQGYMSGFTPERRHSSRYSVQSSFLLTPFRSNSF